MPKRTNAFQELVSLVQRTMLPQGAKVTESAMVQVEGLGAMREIDVLIESDIGPYHMKIAVEAKDHKRKMQVEDIEKIVAKYRGAGCVQVDKVVVVAHRGFSKTAIKRAKLENIELLVLADAKGSVLKNVLQQVEPKPSFAAFGTHIASVELRPEPATPWDRSALTRGELVCKCCGKSSGSPFRYAQHVLHRHLLPSASFQRQAVEAGKRFPNGVCVTAKLPTPNLVFRIDGIDHPLSHVVISVHGRFCETAATVNSYDLLGSDGQKKAGFTHLRQEVDGKGISLVIPEGPNPDTITLKVDEGFIQLPCCHSRNAQK